MKHTRALFILSFFIFLVALTACVDYKEEKKVTEKVVEKEVVIPEEVYQEVKVLEEEIVELEKLLEEVENLEV